MPNIREFINKSSWMGWALAGILLAASVVIYVRGQHSEDPYSPDRMKEMVTIKFTDTNEEVSMPRGQMDRELRRSGEKLDPSAGILNPKTGKRTGFPFNKSEWEE